ncbi:hypothetical protein Y032_0102g3492 [Ancylostoma ceylanicum]|uniref:Uncharacterized protein n=1 Tax=Ancylostoma ceylanicum TaxID=53326 RepID=A0A016THG0_9BILA|nr:hypothetical protein Y032_0102g3492 [Ancylostoma ceylanicum]
MKLRERRKARNEGALYDVSKVRTSAPPWGIRASRHETLQMVRIVRVHCARPPTAIALTGGSESRILAGAAFKMENNITM